MQVIGHLHEASTLVPEARSSMPGQQRSTSLPAAESLVSSPTAKPQPRCRAWLRIVMRYRPGCR